MTEAGTELEISQKVLDEFARMATALEEFDASGMDGILSDIFKAETIDDYNKIFEGERDLPVGVLIQVEKVRYARSEFAAGLPFYLVIDGINTETSEARQWTTGATSVVAMLVRAAFAGHLPCLGFTRLSTKPTKSGYTPVNWHMAEINTNGQQTLAGTKARK